MQAFNQYFEGRVEHCCICFPIDCGAHFLGFVQALSTIYLILQILDIGGYLYFGLPLCAFMGIPAFYYFKMLFNSSKDNREQFAKAYKCYGKTSVAVYGVFVLVFWIAVFQSTKNKPPQYREASMPVLWSLLGMYLVQILLIGHFVKVVHEYTHRAEDHYDKA